MSRFIRTKKILLFTAALGIVGFAAYGVSNITHALAASGQTVISGDNPAIINTLFPSGDIIKDNTICSPLGCAGCSGCTNPQYTQENIAVYEPAVIE
jgi:hypothetical protein